MSKQERMHQKEPTIGQDICTPVNQQAKDVHVPAPHRIRECCISICTMIQQPSHCINVPSPGGTA
jgi:hypothetical protein